MSDRIEPTTIYSIAPYIAQYDNWLTDEDIATILSKDFKFVTGMVHKPDGSLHVNLIRQCKTHRIEYGDDPYFDSLTQRVADFFSIPNLMCIEPFPMMKYNPGDYFDWHSDLTAGFTTQRTATMIMYLNDNFEGGHTHFQHLSLKIKPKRGSVLVYYYTPAETLLHRGAPVISGTKFILTAFVRNGEFTLENRKSVSY
jgi:prolyl 4-hydroxylase